MLSDVTPRAWARLINARARAAPTPWPCQASATTTPISVTGPFSGAGPSAGWPAGASVGRSAGRSAAMACPMITPSCTAIRASVQPAPPGRLSPLARGAKPQARRTMAAVGRIGAKNLSTRLRVDSPAKKLNSRARSTGSGGRIVGVTGRADCAA